MLGGLRSGLLSVLARKILISFQSSRSELVVAAKGIGKNSAITITATFGSDVRCKDTTAILLRNNADKKSIHNRTIIVHPANQKPTTILLAHPLHGWRF